MKILSLGINDITKPIDGLPEYERLFANYFSKKHDVTMINIVPCQGPEKIIETQITPKLKQILVYVPDFFGDIGSDVWKYPDIYKAFFQLGKWKPNVVVLQDWFFAPIIASIPAVQIPVIYICHLFQNAMNLVMNTMNPQAELSELKGMDELSEYIIANSISTGRDIENKFPHVKPKVISSQLGIDKKQYPAVPNLESNIILYMGRLDPMKGLDLFLDEVLENIDAVNGYCIKIAGKGPLLEKVMDAHFKYPEIIQYVGPLTGDEKHAMLAMAKYMVFPSLYEPWGLSLNEGLASGKICVATPVGGHSEQIKHLDNGILTNDSFIRAILDVELNEKLQHNIVSQAVKTARNIEPHFIEVMEVINAATGTG